MVCCMFGILGIVVEEFERWSLSFSTTAKTPAGVSRTVVPVDMGQTRNSSMRAYVFRLTLNSRHCQAPRQLFEINSSYCLSR